MITMDAANIKGNAALLAKVYDFIAQLGADQLNDLIDGRASLRLDIQVDKQLDALISEKLDAKLEEKLGTLFDQKLRSTVSKDTTDPVVDDVSAKDAGKGAKKAKDTAHADKDKGKNKKEKADSSRMKTNAESSTEPSTPDTLELIASEVRSLSSKEGIREYFDKNPLKISAIKSLANKHFNITDTRKKSADSLLNEIIAVVVGDEPIG